MTDRLLQNLENLQKIFYPQSLAVIGANKVKGTVPHDILDNILKADFQGVVYPVSPRETFISSIKTYKYVVDIEDPVDLAILVFPSSVCHMALEQCGEKGIQAAIIISAGFKEVGENGLARERQLVEIAKRYGMSFIGPNCLGVINTDPRCNLDASFARQMPEAGPIGFLSQSGALCTAVLDYAQAKHIGFSKFVSFGNKADINEIDLLYYLRDDPQTEVILIYLEEITDGPALIRAARDVIEGSGKPILALKSGRTAEGASAAASHTGSLAGSDEICEAAFKQAGIIRCADIEEMFNNAIALTYQPLPQNDRIAIITNAGGPGVLTTDSAIHEGLRLAQFSPETSALLRKSLPKTANTKNPVDVIGDARADRYNLAVSSALKDEGVDGVLVILTPQSMTDIDTIAREVCQVSSQFDKPIYASFMGEADVASGIDILQRNRIPHYILPESMCRAFAVAYRFAQSRDRRRAPIANLQVDSKKATVILEKAVAAGHKILHEHEAVRVLELYGLPTLPGALATSTPEAVAHADRIGYPVVLKIMSDQILHKYDIGGVHLNLHTDREVESAYGDILTAARTHAPEADIHGVWVTRMVEPGQEVILGLKRDRAFGPVVLFGLGGLYVEVFKDVVFRVAPLFESDPEEMIREIRSYPILAGARGRESLDIVCIKECICRLAQLATEQPLVQELDINPLIVHNQGCFVTDAKILL
ncbi:acetate--CoA ligase family protein [candidate division KSB1 bacterium]|nr:acetate--CoA ligase family protein [candidate division KSB1 bacterium]